MTDGLADGAILGSAKAEARRARSKGPEGGRHVRGKVVDANVLHVDGDVVLVGQGVSDLLDACVLGDDPLAHLVQGGLHPHEHSHLSH